jgi:hypothetical protein
LEALVAAGLAICVLEFFEGRHQDFGNVAATVRPEMAERIR